MHADKQQFGTGIVTKGGRKSATCPKREKRGAAEYPVRPADAATIQSGMTQDIGIPSALIVS